MHAEITAHRGRLIMTLLADHSIPGEVITSQDDPRFPGQVIIDTSRQLGISKEALQLLRKLNPGSEDVGDLNWFLVDDKPMFFWRGGRYAVFSPDYCSVGKDFGVRGHVEIPNRVPAEARAQLDALPRVLKPKRGLLTGMQL
ncbi:hypothetical protein [Noviherbaspirillum galbum]|uniref:Uncharacterized protein n=1 Tax=Noviherbaspirillum galbum TaxID=2709383 RepID=A0A6B3SR49_9BURK|nr:hypothetical protein [Noviherbaspirillum galbum]NEX63121.1 hypothetical protein [Noviherbaspirillum galbum]